MATIDQLQDLEISRKGYLITPNTNLDFVGTTNNYKGVVGYNEDPNLITLTSTTVGGGFADYLGRLMLWQLPIGTHYTSPFKTAEYVKTAQPTGADMTNCWKKISFEGGGSGYVEKDTYNAYTVLVATTDNNPQAVNLTTNSTLGRIGDVIQSILLDTDLLNGSSDNHDTIPTAKAVIAYVNDQIAGALSFNGGYNVAADTTTADPTKKLQTTPYPIISKGDTYVITVAGSFFGTALGVGDMIISNQATPTQLSHWTLVIKNIPDVVTAEEGVEGILSIATQADVDSGQTNGEPLVISAADSAKAVTPKKLAQRLVNLYTFLKTIFTRKYSTLLNKDGDINKTAFTILFSTHGIRSDFQDLMVSVRDITTGELVEVQVVVNVSKDVIVSFSNPPTDNKYRVTIIG